MLHFDFLNAIAFLLAQRGPVAVIWLAVIWLAVIWVSCRELARVVAVSGSNEVNFVIDGAVGWIRWRVYCRGHAP